jgi:hypothetical protein
VPRERLEIFRVSNTKPKEKIFVLAYEGNNTEALYFEAFRETTLFNDDKIYLYSLRRAKGDTNSSPSHVFNKLKREVKEEFNLENADELWMIIDRDQWINISAINILCKEEGNFYLALSNPCFEFWLLLHLKDISFYNPATQKKIFANNKIGRGKKRSYIKNLLNSIISGGYNESNPMPERFFPYIKDAINRAKSMDDLSEDYPSKLGSHVYKLAEKIVK